MKKILFPLFCLCLAFAGLGCKKSAATENAAPDADTALVLGADRFDQYLPALRGKRVALFSNHTGVASDGRHTLDVLLDSAITVQCVFSPEHGFRGTADAGEHVASSVDPETGVNIVSLYGPQRKQAMEQALDSVDAVVVDIQDVGLRYYTYYCTMLELMNGAAPRGIDVVVLDRPNPNGMYVDGPILDMKLQSGVGRLPIPIVHGLTLGELAQMANGEGWLADSAQAKLAVVPMQNYTHQTRYELPIAPSPNLPNMTSIYLYPSLCYFEGTDVSLGRGTDKPFQIYGHPQMTNRDFEFTPESRPGAANPPQLGNLCHGVDLSGLDYEDIIAKGINLDYVIDAYRDVTAHAATDKDRKFFTSFFDKLTGREYVREMIEQGRTNDEIKAAWAADVEAFKQQRKPYLLYEE